MIRRPAIRQRRMLALLALILVLAPGTWLRSSVPDRYTLAIDLIELVPATETGNGQAADNLAVDGLWQLRGEGEMFGGISAMLLLRDMIRLFSDQGYLYTMPRPDRPAPDGARLTMRHLFPVGVPLEDMQDIESATRSGETGQYWVGYEGRHIIYRYAIDGTPEAWVEPDYPRGWYDNSGFEALVRLESGAFLAFHEGGPSVYLYPGDPVDGAVPTRFTVAWPDDYVPTDAGELPDGRIIVLLRRLGWHLPVFESRLALLDPAELSADAAWPVHPLVQLENLLPRDNWEALAVGPGERAGEVTLWLASDDNRSVFQRSLLAKVRFALPATPG